MAISDAELEEYKRKFHTWLTAEVGLTAEMVKSLQEPSDDWTFIIKIHALLEVALNHMVAGRLRHKELNEIVERLSIAGKTGKIAFAEAFGLLSKESVKFVRLISEVRRNLVHDIKHFDFDLYRYLMNLDKNKQEEWKAALTFNLGSSVHQSLRDFSITFPQFSIFQATMTIMSYSFHAQPIRPLELYQSYLRRAAEKHSESNPKE